MKRYQIFIMPALNFCGPFFLVLGIQMGLASTKAIPAMQHVASWMPFAYLIAGAWVMISVQNMMFIEMMRLRKLLEVKTNDGELSSVH